MLSVCLVTSTTSTRTSGPLNEKSRQQLEQHRGILGFTILPLSATALILTDSNQQHTLSKFTYRHSFPRHWRRMWVQAWPSPAHLSSGWELARWIHSPQGSPMSTDFQTAWPPHLLNCGGKYTVRMLPTVTHTISSRHHTGISSTCLVEKFRAWAKLIMERHLLDTDWTERLGHYQEHWPFKFFTQDWDDLHKGA